MKRIMREISVGINDDGMILIESPDLDPQLFNSIEISPDQVDTICKWLKEAKEELLKSESEPKKDA